MAEQFEDNQYLLSRGTIFDELRNDQKHTDVVIVTSDGSKFPCHKIILIAGCPFFRGLFASDMVETRQKEVNLNRIDISGRLFKQILEFIYTGKIKLNFEDAKAINIYAGVFTMTNLKKISEICLIKHITNETCLELWRHSEKYLNDKLKESCFSSANSKGFLDTHIENLTLEEIKSIVSLKKLNSKILLNTIANWIKIDFDNRQQHIKDLMEFINFDDIKDEEYKRQIFSDDILMENKDFLKLSIKYLLTTSSTSSSRCSEKVFDVPKKTLFVLTNNKIFYTDFDTKKFIATKLCPELEYFGTSSHPTNGFVTTGGKNKNLAGDKNLCTQFFPSKCVKIELPSLLEARHMHRNYTVGSKIYTCGGNVYGRCSNTVEIFDENAGIWIRGLSMNISRQSFGAADDSENSLYAIGGDMYPPPCCYSIERLDIRMKSWQKIYTDNSVAVGYTQSLYKDDLLYCFGEDNGFIFDIRGNKKLASIPYKLDRNKDLTFSQNEFDCTIVDNEIWLIGSTQLNNTDEIPNPFTSTTSSSIFFNKPPYTLNLSNKTARTVLSRPVKVNDEYETPNVFKLDLQRKTWETRVFRGLDVTKNLGLVWCKNN